MIFFFFIMVDNKKHFNTFRASMEVVAIVKSVYSDKDAYE